MPKMKAVKAPLGPPQNEIDNFDISEECQRWGMYSYERPAYTLWSAVGRTLYAHGWTKEEIKAVLRSKYPRWALDGTLGDAIVKAGQQWAEKELLTEREEVQRWIKTGDY